MIVFSLSEDEIRLIIVYAFTPSQASFHKTKSTKLYMGLSANNPTTPYN
ncbi:hypothetical protein [Dysgonomonas termitidis]|uniref:Uncharacterized protein n=1 Tax=Dysgonomonas termitidis TaxID=1516126 RepID=A0ABV9KPP3_9BACT